MLSLAESKYDLIQKFWLEDVKPPLMQAFELVPEGKLDWAPAQPMLTLGNIFMHIAETSNWWIDKIIDNGEFTDLTPCPSLPKGKIKDLLDEHWRRLDHFFDRCPEILEKTYKRQRKDSVSEYTGEWIMMHLLEHDIHHRSQASQYLRLLKIQPPRL